MADPTYNIGSIDFDMEDDSGYSLSNTELNDLSYNGYRGFILSVISNLGDELDDSDFSNWADHSTLTPETSIVAFGDQCAKAQSATSDNSVENFWGGIGTNSAHEIWFYDDGAAATTAERGLFLIVGGTAAPYDVQIGIGIDSSVHATNYIWWNLAVPGWVDTGIVRSTGWHTMRYRYLNTFNFPNEAWNIKLYLGATRLLNIEADTADGDSDPGYGRCKTFGVRTQETGKPLYIDRIRGNKTGALYTASGTVETPPAQPQAVDSWDSITETDDKALEWKGTALYECQWSTDGGGTWNGSWIEASDSNLSGISCDGDGQDAIKFRITLTRHSDTLHTPRARGLTVNFTPADLSVSMGALATTAAPIGLGLSLGAVTHAMDMLGMTVSPAYPLTRDDLLVNPGFELDIIDRVTQTDSSWDPGWVEFAAGEITGWESDVSWGICYVYWGAYYANDGDQFLAGGVQSFGDGYVRQDADLIALGYNATEIDAGHATIDSFSCDRHTESTDEGQILVQCLDSVKSVCPQHTILVWRSPQDG